MVWNERQRKIAELILRHRREDDSYDSLLVIAEVPGVNKSVVSRIARELRKLNWVLPPLPGKGEIKTVKNAGSTGLSSVEEPKSGVISLEISGKKYGFSADDFLKCVNDYLDMQQVIGWNSDFSSTLREGMRLYRAVVLNFLDKETVAVAAKPEEDNKEEDEGDDENGGDTGA
ncbi:MAG: hypothetical protein V1767_00880 [Chloroflexota bacterium]